jgi:hypothetical protein
MDKTQIGLELLQNMIVPPCMVASGLHVEIEQQPATRQMLLETSGTVQQIPLLPHKCECYVGNFIRLQRVGEGVPPLEHGSQPSPIISRLMIQFFYGT